MTEPVTPLQAALADRYRLVRELGQGGMATVYLAEDLKHHRKVAVKVLRPELAATLGPERFAREIEVAARLQHPHILGLLDSGDADGFFYYVMPYVEGETLRERLTRGGELPVPEAVRLLTEIAEALATAHRAGVVHRDIKPENVMLSGRHAMVMDFGVAKAVTDASSQSTLTSAGVALGTPAYMAPEQATADPQMDARVDIYALGVMGYEMLTGAAPFAGLNAQQMLAAHVTRPPIPVGQQREGLSPALEAAVMRCLAKRPADRFQTADELVSALEPLSGPSGGITPTHTQPVAAVAGTAGGGGTGRGGAGPAPRSGRPASGGEHSRAGDPAYPTVPASAPDATGRSTRRIALAGAALLLAAVAAGLALWHPWSRAAPRPLDANLVAVLPFRTAGADPSVQYLRQGMVDLLQAKLTGQGGPRAADARSVLAAVRDAGGSDAQDLSEEAAAGVARKLGAARVLQGSLVGAPDRLVMSAALVAVPGGRTVAQASVSGPKDSLFTMVDRLTAQLLALGAGASSDQLSALTTANLDALRAYLDGVAAYRRGAFQNATPLLSRAVELDSTFALALSALVESDGWHPATTDMKRIRQLAWQYRGRLNPQDSLFLSLRLGSEYPKQTPWTVRIADAERAVQTIPESADAWYNLGDVLFHFGRLADIPQPEVRARQALEQAFQRDSLFGGPIAHLAALTWVTGDTAAQRVWTRRLIALDSAGDNVPFVRWNQLQATRDEPGIRAFLAGLDSGDALVPQGILFFGTLDSVTLANRTPLYEAVHRLSATKPQRMDVAVARTRYLWNLGRPSDAAKWVDTLTTLDRTTAGLQTLLGQHFFGGGPADTTLLNAEQLDVHRFWGRGDAAAGQRLLKLWRERAAADSTAPLAPIVASLIDARLALDRHDPAAARLVDVADSLCRGRMAGASFSSIDLARLYQRQGRVDRALRAIRRRWLPMGEPEAAGLAESYRLEGQLAAQADDKLGAIRAYRNYLRLRVDPEPSKLAQVDSVRAELAAVGDLEGKR